jgi:hypothetical protein
VTIHVTRIRGNAVVHAIETNANGAWVLVCRRRVTAEQILYGVPTCHRCLMILAGRNH